MANLAAVLHGIGDIRVEERPEPAAGPGEVVVAVGAVGICGSDVHYFEHGRIGEYVLREPMVIGHEAAGTVIDIGPGVPPRRLGELVAIEPGIPDMTCDECRAGRYNLCPDVRFFATPPVDGAIVQRLAVPAAFAHPAPAGLTAEQAALAEPVSVGVWACRKAGITPADRVLVTGAGPIGLLAAQVARAYGARQIVVSDVSDVRRAVAAGLGFAPHRAGEPFAGEFDVLLECSGAPPATTAGIAALARAGRAVLVGMGADTVPLDLPRLQGRELTVTGVFRYANCYPTALRLIASGAVDAGAVVTHRFALAETADALSLARRDATALKAVVIPPSQGNAS